MTSRLIGQICLMSRAAKNCEKKVVKPHQAQTFRGPML